MQITTRKEVARHVSGGNYKPHEMSGNGRLAQLRIQTGRAKHMTRKI
jgi:hypothetical protein